jgi:hypothetical protein
VHDDEHRELLHAAATARRRLPAAATIPGSAPTTGSPTRTDIHVHVPGCELCPADAADDA